ncbi:chymotrypsin-1-like [Aphidius gifuensis]|uniref:chymotrypsin-1-like n=1 Tax=Aphidius gifuensis TaxID=684658 RepID=UPI001CDC47DF|nr:chymotrypsin-1-like [Aphidius gifuensis]
MKQFLVLIVLIIIKSVFSKQPSKIINGVVAYDGRHPYQVSIRKNNEHICSGSILDPFHVLTAAQCLRNNEGKLFYDLSNFTVSSGTNNIATTIPVTHPVYKAYIPKTFSTADVYINDIAVLRLSRGIPVDRYRQSIKLPEVDVPENASVILSGWGVLNDTETLTIFDQPTYLRTLITTVINNEDCENYHHRKIYPQHLCTLKDRGYGFCTGDAGNPLVYENTIVGIASWVVSCARGMPDVYTRVYQFVPWIKAILKMSDQKLNFFLQ